MDGDQWGGGAYCVAGIHSILHQGEDLTRSASKGEVLENEPPSQVESSQDQPPLEPDGSSQNLS